MTRVEDEQPRPWGILILVQPGGEVANSRAEIGPDEWVDVVSEVVAERNGWSVVWSHLPGIEASADVLASAEKMLTRRVSEW